MDWPRVTVITPSLNQGDYLEDTIHSVLQQGYPNLEYIIIDGGSTDHSVEIIQRYAPHLAYWVSEKDRGQSNAINKALQRATGDYLTWLNSDDYYLPGCMFKLVTVFLEQPQAGLVCGQVEVIDENEQRIGLFEPVPHLNYVDLLTMKTILPQQAALFSRKAFERVGPISEHLHYAMDVDYFIRIGRYFPILTLPEILARFRMTSTNKGQANSAGWPPEFVQIVHDYFAISDTENAFQALRSQALAGARYRGAATYLDSLQLQTARAWFFAALRANPRYILKPGWWKNLLKTYLGKEFNYRLIDLKVALRQNNLQVNDYDWQTGTALRRK